MITNHESSHLAVNSQAETPTHNTFQTLHTARKLFTFQLIIKGKVNGTDVIFLFLNTLLYINTEGGGMKEHQGNIPNFWRNPLCLETPHRDKRKKCSL